MEINKVQWRMIAKGEKLPCDSFLMKKDGTMTSMVTGAGVTVGQDAYYLSVEELRSFPKEESEDERIRKDIVTYLKSILSNKKYGDKFIEDWIAWLEKQGEHDNFRNKIQIGDKVTRNEDGVLVNLSQLNRVAKKQTEQKLYVNDNAKEMFIKALERVEEQNNKGYKLTDCDKNSWWEDFKAYTSCTIEQKPAAWSDEDEQLYNDLSDTYFYNDEEYPEETYKRMLKMVLDWMDKRAKLLRPKQEWSKEDEDAIEMAIIALEYMYDEDAPNTTYGGYNLPFNKAAERLKSLRPKSQWKPSKEQITWLYRAADDASKDSRMKQVLNELLSDLKKLMEK